METFNKSKFFKNAFHDFFNNKVDEAEIIFKRYFNDNFIFYVDGKVLDKQKMLERYKKLQADTTSIKSEILSVAERGDSLARVHICMVTMKDFSTVGLRVFHIIHFKNNKISEVHEITELLDEYKSNNIHDDLAARY